MRGLIASLFVLTSFAAEAASPEEPYLSARDGYIATFRERESQPLDDGIYNQHAAALKDLERENWWPDLANVPQDPEATLRSEEFYTQGISTDAAVSIYAEVPIAQRATASFAVALLAGRSQDVVPLIPDEVIVSIAAGDRIFVATAPTAVTVTAIPACDLLWQDFQKRADEAYSAYTASDPSDETLFDAYSKIQEHGSEGVRNCFAGHSPREAFFPALVEQAQALVDRLPAE